MFKENLNKVIKILFVVILTFIFINSNNYFVKDVYAATTSKSYTITLNDELKDLTLDYSNGKIAKIKKYSSVKYKIYNIKSGNTAITAKLGNKTYKTNAKVSVNSNGFVTVTFVGDKNMTLSSSNTSIASIQVIETTNTSKTFKITTKKVGTCTLKLKLNGQSTSCKMTIS